MERVRDHTKGMRFGLSVSRRGMILRVCVVIRKQFLSVRDAAVNGEASGYNEKKAAWCDHKKPYESALRNNYSSYV
jgi:hypothetical protein